MTLWKLHRLPPPGAPRPILYLDRDGVLIRDRHYLADPALVELLPGVPAALKRARAAGCLLVGLSNQSGLGRGRFDQAALEAVMARLDELLSAAGCGLDALFYCPHAPEDDCACRKPRPGLLAEAAIHFGAPPAGSWVIGDKASDVALGREQGLGACLVLTGYGAAQRAAVTARWRGDPAVLVAADLAEAVDRILAAAPERGAP